MYLSPVSTMIDLRKGLNGTGPTMSFIGGAPKVSIQRSSTMVRAARADISMPPM